MRLLRVFLKSGEFVTEFISNSVGKKGVEKDLCERGDQIERMASSIIGNNGVSINDDDEDEGEDDDPRINIKVTAINMELICEKDYWGDRMSIIHNDDGSTRITDKDNLVTASFPLNVSRLSSIRFTSLTDGLSNEKYNVSCALIMYCAYKSSVFKSTKERMDRIFAKNFL